MNPKSKITNLFFKMRQLKKQLRHSHRRRYLYRIDLVNPVKKKKRIKKRFLSLRLLKLFFLKLKYTHFRKMSDRAAAADGFFESNFCLLLEGRLSSIIYRSNIVISMFEVLSFLQESNVYLNNVLVNYSNANVRVGDIISFGLLDSSKIKHNFKKRALRKSFLFSIPRFMYVNYKIGFILLEKAPELKDLVYPIRLNVYRACFIGT